MSERALHWVRGGIRTTAWARGLPALVAVLADLPFLPRYFTSEDFLLLRFLREHPPWDDWWGTFFGPWLGISVVGFYRPISTAWFALEGALFAGHSLPYNLVHVAVHAANAVLLAAIARRLGAREWEAAAAAALFAIYPLHPNAVLFLGSFATLFGAMFFLLCLWFFCGLLRSEAPLVWATGAAVCFLLALGSYEACVVLPGWAAMVALHGVPAGAVRRRRAWIGVALLGLVAVAYLAGRHVLFGGVGGYGDLASAWSVAGWPQLVTDALRSLDRLAIPHIAAGPWDVSWVLLRLGALGAAVWVLLRSASREDRGWIGRVLGVSLVGVLVSLAPFSFQPVPPGAGRYWYLASAALSLGIGLALGRLAASVGRIRWAAWAALLGFAVGWSALRVEVGTTYGEAGRLARAVQQSLIETVRGANGPCLVAGVPRFVERHAVPYAQVYHYGLNDSLRPPFSTAGSLPEVLPVLGSSRDLARLRGAPGCRVGWRADLQRFERIAPGDQPAELPVGLSADSRWVRLRAVEGIRYSLMVAAPGNSTSVPLAPAARAGTVRAEMPRAFLQTMNRLYGPRFAWWVEGRGAAGELVSVSTYRPGKPVD